MISMHDINNPVSFTIPVAPMPIVGSLNSQIPHYEHVQEAKID